MTTKEQRQLKNLLLKYQMINFAVVLIFSILIFVGYFKIQYLLAESLFKNNSSEMMVQDFRTVVLSLNQFVPGQFEAIDLVKDNNIIFSIGNKANYLSFASEFITKDKMSLVFISSYKFIAMVISILVLLSMLFAKYINVYFTNAYSKQLDNQIKQQKIEMLNDISKKVAHDIRSPLSTLNMLSALIENNEVREMQNAVTLQIDKIANDLLSHARNENSLNKIIDISINDLFAQMKKEYELKSGQINRQIVFKSTLMTDYRFEDSTIIYQNVNNFINNAIEASADGGLIQVDLVDLSKGIAISVRDFGSGMDEATLKKVGQLTFSTKTIFNSSPAGVNSGNGIALVNAKKDISTKGWELTIDSKLKVGTTITVLIPRNQLEPI